MVERLANPAYTQVMDNGPILDPDVESCIAAAVDRGAFATAEEARSDFWAKLDESIGQADRGELYDIDLVAERLNNRFVSWSRAAE